MLSHLFVWVEGSQVCANVRSWLRATRITDIRQVDKRNQSFVLFSSSFLPALCIICKVSCISLSLLGKSVIFHSLHRQPCVGRVIVEVLVEMSLSLGFQDSGSKTRVPKLWFQYLGSKTQVPIFGFPDSGTKTWVLRSGSMTH